MAFESTGIVRAKRADNGAIWTYLECCPELGRYYRMWCQRPVYYQIHKPSWNEHISITRAEVILDKDYLEKIEGRELSFRYAHHIISDGKRFWLCVESEDLLDVRWNLGLPRRPLVSFHLTIGVNIGYRSDKEPK